MLERESLLREAIDITCGDRNAQYGPPTQDFTRTAAMLNALYADKLVTPFEPEDVAKIVICIKLSRSRWNDKRDNPLDVAGYAGCWWECLQERQVKDAK